MQPTPQIYKESMISKDSYMLTNLKIQNEWIHFRTYTLPQLSHDDDENLNGEIR